MTGEICGIRHEGAVQGRSERSIVRIPMEDAPHGLRVDAGIILSIGILKRLHEEGYLMRSIVM